jgi:hypothetical protein
MYMYDLILVGRCGPASFPLLVKGLGNTVFPFRK